MANPVTISSAPPARISIDYSALREGGMELIRRWAGESWTDHNVHDPGITILEACSYAMTELGLRLQLDVADLLRSGESHQAADLEPAHRVLPVGPVSSQDLRSVLLDHPRVRDARLFLPAESEVAFYDRVGDPPLTYTPGTSRIRPRGLYEVLVELRDDDPDTERALNSNTYTMQVTSNQQTFDIDLALPFWDEPEAAPFREGATVTAVAMLPDPDDGEFWRALPEPLSYFGRLNVGYTGPSGPGSIVTWVLIRITTVLAQGTPVDPQLLLDTSTAVESTTPSAPVVQFAARVHLAAAAVKELQSYLAGWRNLGEQAVRIGLARVQEIAVRARIEVTGGIDLEQLLADIFADLDQMLSPRVRFESLAGRRRAQPDSDAIYDGPLLRNGVLASDAAAAAHPGVLFLSDVLREIMQRRRATRSDVVTQENPVGRDIVAVTDLALTNFINNRPITSDAEDCLHLVEVERFRPRLSVSKSRIVAVRNDSEVSYDLNRVKRLFDELLKQADAGSRTADTSPVWPVPHGDLLPVDEYTPLQEDLPALYGVGHSELPDSAGATRHAAVKQLQGYLLLFEQLLADVTAQLGNVNRFFSADAGENATYFTRPLFDLPGIPALLRRFSPGGNWATFVGDPNNPFVRALHDAAESQTQVLDRRNRMLDHLLARQGEDTVALGQEVHRWAQAGLDLVTGNPSVSQQLERIAARRDAANARLMRIKAALLHDAPELNAFRLLANSNPLGRFAALLRIESVGAPPLTTFRWHLSSDAQELLQSVDTFATTAAASIAAENALVFAARSTLYDVVVVPGGQRQLRVRDGTAPAHVIAESSQTFNTAADANTARAEISGAFARLRLESSLAPLERRIAYLTGIRSQFRRRLLNLTNVLFEIVDDPPGPGLFGKRWRLHELPGNAGQVLLNSRSGFQHTTNSGAIALAQQSIRQVLEFGMDEWNYVIPIPTPGNPFTFQLQSTSGTTLAVPNTTFPSRAAAEQAVAATIEHLYRNYGAEGFYLIEHLLLRPMRRPGPTLPAGDRFLSLPVGTERERDPYSQRISIVFPSGFARNFSNATAPATEVTPDRFRDREFRRHAERVIQQACPAHLMPTVYWVDRQAPGTPNDPASFDAWEQRYFDWLDTVLIPGAPDGTVDSAREAVVEALNGIANDAP